MQSATSTEEYWRKHIERQSKSNLNQSKYCAKHNLKLATFHYWRKKLEGQSPGSNNKKAKANTKPDQASFVELPIAPKDPGEQKARLRIRVNEDNKLTIEMDLATARELSVEVGE
jgi:hypothetical protein